MTTPDEKPAVEWTEDTVRELAEIVEALRFNLVTEARLASEVTLPWTPIPDSSKGEPLAEGPLKYQYTPQGGSLTAESQYGNFPIADARANSLVYNLGQAQPARINAIIKLLERAIAWCKQAREERVQEAARLLQEQEGDLRELQQRLVTRKLKKERR